MEMRGSGRSSSAPRARNSAGVSGVPTNLRPKSPRREAREIFHAAKERESCDAARNGKYIEKTRSSVQVSDYAATIKDLETSLTRINITQTRLEAEVARNASRYTQLSESMSSSKQLIDGYVKAIPALQNDIKALQRTLDKKSSNGQVDRIVSGNNGDISEMSEQIFRRVHQEFNNVVSDVVKACISEQNHRIAETVQRYINTLEGKHETARERDKASIAKLQQQMESMEGKIRSLQSAVNDRGLQFERIQDSAVQTYRGEMQSVLELMTKKVNDCIAANRLFVADTPAEIERRVVTNVNAGLQSICNNLDLRSDRCDNAIKSLINKSNSLEDSLADIRHKLFRTENLASHALNLTSAASSSERVRSRQEQDCIFLQANSPDKKIHNGTSSNFTMDQHMHDPGEKLADVEDGLHALEKEHSDSLCRLNVLHGSVEELKELTSKLEFLFESKITEMSGNFDAVQNRLQRYSSDFEVVEASIKRHEGEITDSSEKFASESRLLRSELSACLTNQTEMKSEFLLLKDEISTKPSLKETNRFIKRLLSDALDSRYPDVLVVTPDPTFVEEGASAVMAGPNSSLSATSPLFRPVAVAPTSQSMNDSDVIKSPVSLTGFTHDPSQKTMGEETNQSSSSSSQGLQPADADADAIRGELADVIQDVQKNREEKCRSIFFTEIEQRMPRDACSVHSGSHSESSLPRTTPNKSSVSDLIGRVENAFRIDHRQGSVSSNSNEGSPLSAGGNNVSVSMELLKEKRKAHRRKFQQDILNGRAFA